MSTVRWVDMAVAQAEAADKALSVAVDEATATEYKADQLKEPKLLDKLDAAIRKAKALKGIPEDRPGEWLAWRLASARKANATDADEANAQVKALKAALKAVKDSKLAKELDTAKDHSSGRVLTPRARPSRTRTGRWRTTPPATASRRPSTRRTTPFPRRASPTRRRTPTPRRSWTPPSGR